MRITTMYPTIDAPDIDAEARFWAGVLGGEVADSEIGDDERWRNVVVDGQVRLAFQYAPDFVAPRWPATSREDQVQQVHLDVYVEHADVPAARDEVLVLGATLLQEAPDPDAKGGFHVFADPAGHPFCICWE